MLGSRYLSPDPAAAGGPTPSRTGGNPSPATPGRAEPDRPDDGVNPDVAAESARPAEVDLDEQMREEDDQEWRRAGGSPEAAADPDASQPPRRAD